jgi:hypothetical protein
MHNNAQYLNWHQPMKNKLKIAAWNTVVLMFVVENKALNYTTIVSRMMHALQYNPLSMIDRQASARVSKATCTKLKVHTKHMGTMHETCTPVQCCTTQGKFPR